MAQLGEILLERQWITPEQLQLARRRQKELGGRIGTCLLEIGALSEELLLRSLSEQVGVPRAPIRELHCIPSEVASLLAPDKAAQYRGVPFRQLGGQIEVALEEVSNLRVQDEISFLLGKRVRIHIASEARIAEALSNVYGQPCSARMSQLLARLNRSREFHQTVTGTPAPATPARVEHLPAPKHAPPPLGDRPAVVATTASGPALARDDVQSALGSRVKTRPIPISAFQPLMAPAASEAVAPGASIGVGADAPAPSQGPTPVPRPGVHSGLDTPAPSTPAIGLELGTAFGADAGVAAPTEELRPGDSLEERMIAARSPDDLGQLLLEELEAIFDRVVIFHYTEGAIRGWKAAGVDLDTERLQRYTCPLDIPSIFLTLEQGGGYFVGQLPSLPAHRRLTSFLESGPRTRCLVVPVRLNDRLVCTLFADRDDRAFGTEEIESTRRLAAQAELAFRILILREKMVALRMQSEESGIEN